METTTLQEVNTIRRIGGLPLLGNLLDFRRDRLALQSRLYNECGAIGEFRMGPVKLLMVTSPELAHEILVDHAYDFRKSAGLRVFGAPLVGDGILVSEHGKHKRQRRLMAPAFTHKRIADYATVMAAYAERAQGAWTDGEPIDIANEMMRLTLAIVGKTLFDTDIEHEAQEISDALTEGMHYMIDSVTSLLPLPLGVPTPRHRRLKRAVARLDETVYRMIRERRASGEDRGDVLSMLLLSRDQDDGTAMTDVEVRDEAMTVLLAGHETTANALSWAWTLLAQHPDVYARLQAEADGVLGGRTAGFEDLPRLPYALQVAKEAMRLCPPAYIIGREAERDVVIGGHAIAKGTVVFVNIYAMHRRADFFAAPETFNPDRFTASREKELPRFAYLPFGAGPRVCIGNHFALMEQQLVLATLAQRVTFERASDERIVPEPLVTLRPLGGVPMRVRRRAEPVGARSALG